MLRKFAAVLLATTLIAGPAFAAQPSDNAAGPAATTQANHPAQTKTVKRMSVHVRKRAARGRAAAKLVRNVKTAKTHRHFAHIAKPAGKASTKSHGVKAAKLPSAQNVVR